MFTTIEQLRNPEYTGENRCVPCTITNVALAAAGALALTTLSVPLGAAAFVVALVVVALRGYLVPGTPAFTRRYFPEWLLAAFEKTDPPVSSVDAAETLVAAGVLVDADTDLELSPTFASAWRQRIRALREERERPSALSARPLASDGTSPSQPDDDSAVDALELAALTGLDPASLSIQHYGEAVVANLGDERIGRWESRAAFDADMAAAHELENWVPRWRSYPLSARSEVLGSLRLFIEHCPACDALVTLEQDVVKSCCRNYDVVAVSCSGCGSRLLEADFDVSVLGDVEDDTLDEAGVSPPDPSVETL